jgi:hypothetical protein
MIDSEELLNSKSLKYPAFLVEISKVYETILVWRRRILCDRIQATSSRTRFLWNSFEIKASENLKIEIDKETLKHCIRR